MKRLLSIMLAMLVIFVSCAPGPEEPVGPVHKVTIHLDETQTIERDITEGKALVFEGIDPLLEGTHPAIAVDEDGANVPVSIPIMIDRDREFRITNWSSMNWKINKATGELTSVTGMDDKVIIPYDADGALVTGLGEYLFRNNQKLKDIEISPWVASIGNSCFMYAKNLNELHIPSTVKYLGRTPFFDSSSDAVVWIESWNQQEDWNYRWNDYFPCQLKSSKGKTIEGITYIETYDDEGNMSYTVADTKGATGDVVVLGNIDGVPVRRIGHYAFSKHGDITSITIPDGITVLETNSFSEMKDLTSISLPESLERIEDAAFYNVNQYSGSALTLNLGSKVEYVGVNAFAYVRLDADGVIVSNAELMESWNPRWADDGSNGFSSSCLGYKDSMEYDGILYAPMRSSEGWIAVKKVQDNSPGLFSSLNLPAEVNGKPVKRIGSIAFASSYDLSRVILPKGLESIGSRAFLYCPKLTEIEMPSTLKNIDAYAFHYCEKLKTIKLNEGLVKIGDEAFSQKFAPKEMDAGSKLIIPSTVKKMGSNIVRNSAISSVVVTTGADTSSWNSDWASNYIGAVSFEGGENIDGFIMRAIKAKDGSKAYEVAGTTLTDAEIVIPAKVGDIPVIAIGHSAFKGNSTMKKVTIPSGVVRIDDRAFRYAYNLENVILPDTLESIGNEAFLNTYALKEIIIPGSVKVLGDLSFANTQKLANLVLNEGLEQLGKGVFQQSGIEEIVLPESLSTMGTYCFASSSVKKLVFPENLEEIPEGTCSKCNNLENIVFPKKLRIIGKSAFEYIQTKGTLDIVIPDTYVTLWNYAFYESTGIRSVELPASIKLEGSNWFKDWTEEQTIIVNNRRSVPNNETWYGNAKVVYK